MSVDVYRNFLDIIEELDKSYPSFSLEPVSCGLWSIKSSAKGYHIGSMHVKMLEDGCCAKVSVNDSGGIIRFPRLETVIMVPSMSDSEEKAKLDDLFDKVREKALVL